MYYGVQGRSVLIESEITPETALELESPPTAAVPPLAAPVQPIANPVTIIKACGGWQAVNFVQLWAFRELLYFLIWRDIKVRYKQTVLGAAWAIIQPVMTMVVFSLFLADWGA